MDNDQKQLADLLLTDPNTGETLQIASPVFQDTEGNNCIRLWNPETEARWQIRFSIEEF